MWVFFCIFLPCIIVLRDGAIRVFCFEKYFRKIVDIFDAVAVEKRLVFVQTPKKVVGGGSHSARVTGYENNRDLKATIFTYT